MKRRSVAKVRKMIEQLLSIGNEMTDQASVEDEGDLYMEFLSMGDQILEAYGLQLTEENQNLFLSMVGSNDLKAAAITLRGVLDAKSGRPVKMSAFQYLCYALSEGKSAADVLPRMRLTNHEYHQYLYDLAKTRPALLVDVYNEMCAAQPHLAAIEALKFDRDALVEKQLHFLDAYMRSDSM
ncbi:MAG: hypothetical protein JW797_03515 [Bradymonadales bacterium]|nr:hypothetical protein [Bradymonadales bacterium]